jgi:hypothetical protein
MLSQIDGTDLCLCHLSFLGVSFDSIKVSMTVFYWGRFLSQPGRLESSSQIAYARQVSKSEELSMPNKTEIIGSEDVLNMPSIEITPLGGDGPALNPGLIVRSEIVNWSEVAAPDSEGEGNGDCGHSRPIKSCFETCYK